MQKIAEEISRNKKHRAKKRKFKIRPTSRVFKRLESGWIGCNENCKTQSKQGTTEFGDLEGRPVKELLTDEEIEENLSKTAQNQLANFKNNAERPL